MIDRDRCPVCGRDRPAGAAEGLCPICQVRLVLTGIAPEASEVIAPLADPIASVLEELKEPEPPELAFVLPEIEPEAMPEVELPTPAREVQDFTEVRMAEGEPSELPVPEIRAPDIFAVEPSSVGWSWDRNLWDLWATRIPTWTHGVGQEAGRSGLYAKARNYAAGFAPGRITPERKRWLLAAALGVFAVAAGPGISLWHGRHEGRKARKSIAVVKAPRHAAPILSTPPPPPTPPVVATVAPILAKPDDETSPPTLKAVDLGARDEVLPLIEMSEASRAEGVGTLEPIKANDAECAAEEADRRLLDRAVEARGYGPDDPDGTAREWIYAGAFRDAGIDPDTLAADAAQAKIKGRPAATAAEMIEALDVWASVRRGRGDREGANRLTEIARLADPDPWRDRVRSALKNPEGAASLAELVKLARATPVADVSATSMDLLGRSLADLGDFPAAETVLRLAHQRHPADPWVSHDLAEVLVRLGRDDDAIRFDTAARSIRPEAAHALAHTLARVGETDDAIAVFRDLVKRRPGDARQLACLGRTLKEAGRSAEGDATLDAAIAAYRAGLKAKADDSIAHDGLGLALLARGELADAVGEIREAVRLKPDFARAHLDLGNVLTEQGRADPALAEYKLAVLLQPGFGEARRRLGLAFCASGQYDEAATELREAVKARPDDLASLDALGTALSASDRFDEAIAVYREAVRSRPKDAMMHNRLGVLLFDRKHDAAGAIAAFRESARLQPGLAEAHFNLGNALKADGRLNEALVESREAARLKPDYAEAYVNIGLLLRGGGRLDDAIAAYREAARLKPDLAEAHLCLGYALTARGDLTGAADAYQQLLRLRPDDAEARRLLDSVRQPSASSADPLLQQSGADSPTK